MSKGPATRALFSKKIDPVADTLIRTEFGKGSIGLSLCGRGNEAEFAKYFVPLDLFKERTLEILSNQQLRVQFNQQFYDWAASKLLIKEHFRQNLLNPPCLSSSKLLELNLQPNHNTVEYSVASFGGARTMRASIYLWTETAKLVISDIDGTITKSDILGHLFNLFGKDYTHDSIGSLYNTIVSRGYKIVYISSRSLSFMKSTKKLLFCARPSGTPLPGGPVILSSDRLVTCLLRELSKTANLFKQAILSEVGSLFPSGINPFHAGFGNRATDELSYKAAGIALNRIFTINPKGVLVDSLGGASNGYIAVCARLDELFPP